MVVKLICGLALLATGFVAGQMYESSTQPGDFVLSDDPNRPTIVHVIGPEGIIPVSVDSLVSEGINFEIKHMCANAAAAGIDVGFAVLKEEDLAAFHAEDVQFVPSESTLTFPGSVDLTTAPVDP